MTKTELKQAMEALGVTYKELADWISHDAEMPFDHSTTWRWVKGDTRIPAPAAAYIRLLWNPLKKKGER